MIVPSHADRPVGLLSRLLIKVRASTSGGPGFRFIVLPSVLSLVPLRPLPDVTMTKRSRRTPILLFTVRGNNQRGSRVVLGSGARENQDRDSLTSG